MPTKRSFDQLLLIIVLILMGYGLIMVYSSSAIIAETRYNVPSYHFMRKQAINVGLSLIILFIAISIPFKKWQELSSFILLFSILLLGLVYFPGLGKKVGGALRWIKLLNLRFQPAEFAKLAIIIYLANFLTQKPQKIENTKEILFSLLIILGFPFLFIIKQPDLGTAVIIVLLTFYMIYSAGAKIRHLLLVGLIFFLCLSILIYFSSYQSKRILDFFNSLKSFSDVNFQIKQSLRAFISGGLFGRGFHKDPGKAIFIPEAHTDFIFAIIGQELGIVGTFIVLICFGLIIWRGSLIANYTKDPFAHHLALGITFLVGIQALLNMFITIGWLPTKGLPLPFMSYGGSSLLVNALSVGILLNISGNE
jgi:cell division protein FtsW